jgi:hypothetical protein
VRGGVRCRQRSVPIEAGDDRGDRGGHGGGGPVWRVGQPSKRTEIRPEKEMGLAQEE